MKRAFFILVLLCVAVQAQAQRNPATATFAMGCFWCGEEALEKAPGVLSVVSGYTDGRTKNPSYEMVSSGTTGHTEAVQVTFDPSKLSYEKLLDVFWVNHDPTYTDRQFCDHGSQYRPGIFWHDEEQKRLAEASKEKYDKLRTFKQPIVTPIVKATQFWPAEEYHQDYYKKNPVRYKFYSTGCGRYTRLDELWGKLRK
ncbi:MAG: peptide-methionine (S)-S-oxide reductase [Betaproteobacteria bacterium RBG_16_66_20]|nr:MAG: peptide-methionine (S)-S-oxide reductase [Betaproteobacteria bacterium RBG_16_66_20]